MQDFDLRYEEYRVAFEDALQAYALQVNLVPDVLKESMFYSLFVGGKRIRPVLLLSTAEMLGVKREEVLPFALAIEMIHTYSLIHDDLPAMDNDDFRRGKASNHKVFGEANAILAGDALLNTAFSLCFKESHKGERFLSAAEFLCNAAGAEGMIAGQSADLLFSENDEFGVDDLEFIYENKTGKLLTAPVVMASILANGKERSALEAFGRSYGKLFQLTDDILDVTGKFEQVGKTLGKDKDEDKLTCIKVYGYHNSVFRAQLCAEECRKILTQIDGDTSFLHGLVDKTVNRNK